MPMYNYRCPDCGALRTVIKPIARRNEPEPPCGICESNKKMKRDMPSETLGSSDLPYDTPVYSDALGVNPDQVPEHRARFPHIPITNEGQIVLTSHSQRRKVLKELGFIDKDGFY